MSRGLENYVTERIDASGDCWEWTGSKRGQYGGGYIKGYVFYAHRYIYERLVAEIPEGYDLDHLCKAKLCVNPDHLEPVTHRENTRRAMGTTAERCKRGHRDWVILTKGRDAGYRTCAQCGRERALAHYHRNKATA